MISFAISHYEKLEAELKKIVQEEDDAITRSEKSVNAIVQYIDELKIKVHGYSFNGQGEEIEFFKTIKPRFFAALIYHSNIVKLESGRPTGSFKVQRKFFNKQLYRIKVFFDDNSEFYRYVRTGSTHLDEVYFLRHKLNVKFQPDPYLIGYDALFSTSHDLKMAMILANEVTIIYINSKVAELKQHKYSISKAQDAPKKKLLWTAPKTALIELAYAFQASGVFNNSNADVRQIASYLQSVFNVDLGNYYRTFQEIRIRKSGRTNFLDNMKAKLIQRMDDTDDNPKESKYS